MADGVFIPGGRSAQLRQDMAEAQAIKDRLRFLVAKIHFDQNRRPISEADERAMKNMQIRADAVYVELGRRAPPANAYEWPDEYRIRLLEGIKHHSKTWKDTRLDSTKDEAFLNLVEQQIFEEARADSAQPVDLKPGEMRAIEKISAGGHKQTTFVAKDTHFVRQFTRPAARAQFKSREQYEQQIRDAQTSRTNQLMQKQADMVKRGQFVVLDSSAPPMPSTENPVVSMASAVASKIRRGK
jgi:hypothetical protein